MRRNLQVKFMYTSMVDISSISPRVILKLLKAAETYQVKVEALCSLIDGLRLRW